MNWLDDLIKNNPTFKESLENLGGSGGGVSSDDVQRLNNHLNTDTLTGLGNRKAYNEHISKNPEGFHIHIEGNDHGHLTKTHGIGPSEDALKAYAQSAQSAMDTMVGRGKGKLFRLEGDKFAVHIPTETEAHSFVRAFRNHLESHPPIMGTHNMAATIGIGSNQLEASGALKEAKADRKAMGYEKGSSQTHIKIHGSDIYKSESEFPDLQKMAIKGLAPGPQVQQDIYDYSHLLTPAHRASGYKVQLKSRRVGHGRHTLESNIFHNEIPVGFASSFMEPDHLGRPAVNIEHSNIEPEHQRKGLGVAAYEALLTHGHHKLGATRVAGDIHSTSASGVHQKLSDKHGMDYKPQDNPNKFHEQTGPYDNRFSEYNYPIK